MAKVNDDSMLFPQKLMEILADPSNQNAIAWLPHGKAFVVYDRDILAESVMPKYFSRQAKYSSFTRKLNRWNFQRIAKGPESGAYYHHFFLRDKPHLAAQMFCKNARTLLAMVTSNDKKANDDEVEQPEVPTYYSSSMSQDNYGDSVANLPNSVPMSRLNHKTNVNPSHFNMISASRSSNRLQPFDHHMINSLIHQQDMTNLSFVEGAMLQIQNDRQAAALSLHQQQTTAAVAMLESDYLRRLHLQRMVELSMQEMQKEDQTHFHLGHAQLPPPPKGNGGSPPSGTKRASAA